MKSNKENWRSLVEEAGFKNPQPDTLKLLEAITQKSQSVFVRTEPPKNYSSHLLTKLSERIDLNEALTKSKTPSKSFGKIGFLSLINFRFPQIAFQFSLFLVVGLATWGILQVLNPKENINPNQLFADLSELSTADSENWLASIGNAEDRLDVVAGGFSREFTDGINRSLESSDLQIERLNFVLESLKHRSL